MYTKLLRVLQHHSLSQLLVELLQIKIVNSVGNGSGNGSRNNRDRFSSDFDDRFGKVLGINDDEEDKKDNTEEDPTAGMTAIER